MKSALHNSNKFEHNSKKLESIYNQYPGNPDQYPKGTPQQYPFSSQFFTNYNEKQIIAESCNKDPKADLIVTSGKLYTNIFEGKLQAFTDTYNFRLLLNVMDKNQVRVGWTNSIINVVVTPVFKQPNQPTTAGIHLFTRYHTSNDLYVASLRFDGLATIKKQINGIYTTLGEFKFGVLVLGKTYKLQLKTKDDNISFYIDGKKVVYVNDNSLSWGTAGIRIDYTDCYIESIRITTPSTYLIV
jgi:hypothetical protein